MLFRSLKGNFLLAENNSARRLLVESFWCAFYYSSIDTKNEKQDYYFLIQRVISVSSSVLLARNVLRFKNIA